MEIGNNDTVLFYYFGHSTINTNNNALTYCIIAEVGERPDLGFGCCGATKYTYITKKSIIDLLRAKNPRLIVVLSDCCSTKLPILLDPGEDDSGSKIFSSPPETLPLYRSLFLESKGLVDISSIQDNQYTFFLDAFCHCLDQYKNQQMDWKTFFSKVQKTTEVLVAKDIRENNRIDVTEQKLRRFLWEATVQTVTSGDKPIFGVRCLNRNDNDSDRYAGITGLFRHKIRSEKRRCKPRN
jgi:hypothetical protein